MSGVNKAIILGAVGRDPEVRYTTSGTANCHLSIATSYKPKNGEEQTEWHRVVLFDKLAEVAGQYVKKGRQVYIEGRLKTRKWEDKDGIERYTTEIMGDVLQMVGPKDGGSEKQAAPQRSKPASKPQSNSVDDMDWDIPF